MRSLFILVLGTILALPMTQGAAEPSRQGSNQFAPGQQSGPAKKSALGQRQTYPGEAKKFAPGQQGKVARKRAKKGESKKGEPRKDDDPKR